MRWVPREEFDRAYEELRASQAGRKLSGRVDRGFVSDRGRETRWAALCTIAKHGSAKGAAFRSTNCQRARAMELAGRERGERTMQRVHRDLAAMGLVVVRTIHRKGATPGKRDCLHLRLVQSYVTPLRGAGEEESSNDDSPALGTTLRPPATPADDEPPPVGGGNGSDEESDWAARVLRSLDEPLEDRRARRQRLESARRHERLRRYGSG